MTPTELKESASTILQEIHASKCELQEIYNKLYPVGTEVTVVTAQGHSVARIHEVPSAKTMIAKVIDDEENVDEVSARTLRRKS